MRIAIIQSQMRPTVDESVRTLLRDLSEASALGATVALFPECALTGYTLAMVRATAEDVARYLRRAQERCAALGLAAVVGLPWQEPRTTKPWNAAAAIDPRGEIVAITAKQGLTSGEFFFARGATRPVFALRDHRCAVMIGRELYDDACARRAEHELHGRVDVLFWPALMAWNAADELERERLLRRAQGVAQRVGAVLVQANWPNRCDLPYLPDRHPGRSTVLASDGEVMHESPVGARAIAVIDLQSSDSGVIRAAAGGQPD